MALQWIGSPEHTRWLGQHTQALLDFARRSRVPGGFGWIGPDGVVDSSRPVELWITGRMTYVFSVGVLLGVPGCRRYADHGVQALTNAFWDETNGGWFSAIEGELDEDGHGRPAPGFTRKECYQHAFVLLGAATALAAGRPGAAALLKRALEVHERYFFDHSQSMPTESYALDFTDPEDYRGINAAMHTVEAYLAIADATGDDRWLERALGIVDFAINQQARAHGWRIPEHYSTTWVPDPDYNIDEVAHPFRPFGITPGHGLEWARLTVQLRAALLEVGLEAPAWMLPAALELFTRSRADGWNRDGAPGFVYTVDFVGTPVVHERMHWVTCEAISAAAALHCALVNEPVPLAAKATSMAYLEHAYRSAWDYCEQYIIGGGDPFTRAEIDPQNAPLAQAGAWVHELDQANQPSTRTWAGYPDIYHALQATLIPRVPVWPVLPGALRDGLLDR